MRPKKYPNAEEAISTFYSAVSHSYNHSGIDEAVDGHKRWNDNNCAEISLFTKTPADEPRRLILCTTPLSSPSPSSPRQTAATLPVLSVTGRPRGYA